MLIAFVPAKLVDMNDKRPYNTPLFPICQLGFTLRDVKNWDYFRSHTLLPRRLEI
jgi:hypothetical protein